MKKANHTESNNLFRQSVLVALMEQEKIDPTPLRAFLLRLLDMPQSSQEKIGWLKSKNTLTTFYNLLKTHKFINYDFELFKSHFEGISHIQDKIIWNENLNELVYLFARLREEGIIPLHKKPHVLLQENFLDKYKKPINSGSLRTLLEKGIRNNNRVELIDDIIDDILSNKNINS